MDNKEITDLPVEIATAAPGEQVTVTVETAGSAKTIVPTSGTAVECSGTVMDGPAVGNTGGPLPPVVLSEYVAPVPVESEVLKLGAPGTIEETENQIRARIRNPEDFKAKTFKTIQVTGAEGVSFVVGKLRNKEKGHALGSLVVQSVRFDKKHFDRNSAAVWIKSHKESLADVSGQGFALSDNGYSYLNESNDSIVCLSSHLGDPEDEFIFDSDGYLMQEVLRPGTFRRVFGSDVVIDEKVLSDMIKHFSMGVVRDGVMYNIEHDPGRGAAGWVRKLGLRPKLFLRRNSKGEVEAHDSKVLVAHIKLTKFGREEVVEGEKYPYASVELAKKQFEHEVFDSEKDNKKGQDALPGFLQGKATLMFENVLTGLAATSPSPGPSIEAHCCVQRD